MMRYGTTETVHVRYGTCNRGRREWWAVMRDSERNVSGTPLRKFRDRNEADRAAAEHNAAVR